MNKKLWHGMGRCKTLLTILLSLVALDSISSQTISNIDQIKSDLEWITKTKGFRTHDNVALLDRIAENIYTQFEHCADTVFYQKYKVNGSTYRNVVCSFGDRSKPVIILGAHYDVCNKQEGADDNASGVVALLQLSHMLQEKAPADYCVELVAYTLEEPPYFRTNKMGSFIHAQSLAASQRTVYGMISLEMIGYYDDNKKSQDYPIGVLKWIYGNTGDYITLVNKFGKGKFARKFSRRFKKQKKIKTKKFTGPKSLPGIDFSDHLNYWALGYSALMVTDTAFYRNKNYHQHGDTMEKLDLHRMAQVIDTIYATLFLL